jgi:hypothetical protein
MNPMDSMNEDTVRTLLAVVADVPEPVSRISVEKARKAGRRRQWTARVIGSGAAVAVAVAGALIVPHVLPTAASASASGPAAGTRQAAQVTPSVQVKPVAPAPAQFNPQVIPANFGWLPSFWNEEQASITVTPTLAYVNLKDGQTLKVSARGWYPSDAEDGNFATVRGSYPRAATDPKAPPVNGQPAYWDKGDGGRLVWEYAPGGWAFLYGTGNTSAPQDQVLVEEIASRVRFGQQSLYTPFKVAQRLPAGWQVTETDSIVTNGRALVWQLSAGPAANPNALSISNDPKNLGTQCGVAEPSAQQSDLTVGGFQMVSYYASGTGQNGYQSLCSKTPVNNGGYLSMEYYWRDHNQAFNLASLARSMTFLGTNPAGWSTQPIAG